MLRLLSIRNFVVVEALDVEFDAGFSVLTGETGAGKSILLDALALLLGDRFELRQLRPGAERAELAAVFDVGDAARRRARGSRRRVAATPAPSCCCAACSTRRARAARGSTAGPATLAQLAGSRRTCCVDLHGQHAHQSLAGAEAQRELLDAFGGFAALARETSRQRGARGAMRPSGATRPRPMRARRAAERERLADRAARARGARAWRRRMGRAVAAQRASPTPQA